jgi:hypothetical protein
MEGERKERRKKERKEEGRNKGERKREGWVWKEMERKDGESKEGRKEGERMKERQGEGERNVEKRWTIHYLIAMYVKMLTIMVPIIPIAAPIIMPFWKQGLLKSLKKPMKPNVCSSLLLLLLFELFALFCRAIYEKCFYYSSLPFLLFFL